MHNLDFSSWRSLLATLAGLALVTLIGVGIRVLMMVTLQQRRERVNRQINERLRTLISAYKTLGGSFTGDLTADPRHKRDLHGDEPPGGGSDRARRIRDAVEAALSDIILLGTEEQVELAAAAVRDLVAGRPIHTHALVVSLRTFIRDALDLAPIPSRVAIPQQGPARPSPSGGKGGGGEGNKGGSGGGGGGMGLGGGMGGGGVGGMSGLGGREHDQDEESHDEHGLL